MLKLDEVKIPLIAILRGIEPHEAAPVAAALLGTGIEVLEVTMNSPAPLTTLATLIAACGDSMLVGCGTVLDVDEVDAVADAGGGLIVSPNFNPAVVAQTKKRGMVSAPGCLTPTEMFAAFAAGADVVKLFPGNIVTPAVIKAYKTVLPQAAKLVVTGGVAVKTIAAYKAAGAYGMGLGSNLYKSGKDPQQVGADARSFVAAYQAA